MTLLSKILSIVAFHYYPPEYSKHYNCLELDKDDIGKHRDSFLLKYNNQTLKLKDKSNHLNIIQITQQKEIK